MKRIKILTLGLAAATTLFFAGCSEGDHAAHTHDADAATEVAGKPADVAGAMAVIEKPTAEQLGAAKPYPLDTCLISGEKLGEMGEPILLVVGNQQVKLCCDNCLPDIKKDPAKALAKLAK